MTIQTALELILKSYGIPFEKPDPFGFGNDIAFVPSYDKPQFNFVSVDVDDEDSLILLYTVKAEEYKALDLIDAAALIIQNYEED